MITYNVEHEGKIVCGNCLTIPDAEKAANDWWADKNEQLSNGNTAVDVVLIVGMDDDDERVSSVRYVVEFTGYHGDYAEHNTHWGL